MFPTYWLRAHLCSIISVEQKDGAMAFYSLKELLQNTVTLLDDPFSHSQDRLY
jgi:hypothetical protein